MGKLNGLPERAQEMFANGELARAGQAWVSVAGLRIEMFSQEQSESLNLDLELWRKMPGWFAIGQDADDCLLCVDARSGRCSLIEVDQIDADSALAHEIAPNVKALFSQGSWA